VGIRKEVFSVAPHHRLIPRPLPAPPLDAETLRELEDLVEYLGLTEGDEG
jgi:hypothetical protein